MRVCDAAGHYVCVHSELASTHKRCVACDMCFHTHVTIAPPPRDRTGLCAVPTRLYPVALLVVLQLLVPGLSLLGHLCGLAFGFLFAHGTFRILYPSADFWRRTEARLSFVSRRRSYVSVPDADEPYPYAAASMWSYVARLPVARFLPRVPHCSRPCVLPLYWTQAAATSRSTTAATDYPPAPPLAVAEEVGVHTPMTHQTHIPVARVIDSAAGGVPSEALSSDAPLLVSTCAADDKTRAESRAELRAKRLAYLETKK